MLGQEVAVLADGELATGTHKVTWDAAGFPSGIYFVRMNAETFTATKRMVLLK